MNTRQPTGGPRRTLSTVWAAMALSAVFGASAYAQIGSAPAPMSTGSDCGQCHTCDNPTPENPCLISCSRSMADAIGKEFARKHGPDVVILDDLEDRYLPVPFDHAGHAAMADMTKGCAACHHYTPEGLKHPACKSCHEISPRRDDMNKPGLKGAYHRQCLACHRDWSGETQCALCHQAKTALDGTGVSQVTPTKDDLIGRMHPPIPEPDEELYRIEKEGQPVSRVLFRHKEHIHSYGLACSDCHLEDNCRRCHVEGGKHVQQVRTFEDHHKPCNACHKGATANAKPGECKDCHYGDDQAAPPPFDHASTGWPLNRHHHDLSCRECHTNAPYSRHGKDGGNCVVCHANWSPESFDHTITGQTLDANHASQDCEMCHVNKDFRVPPTCTECHEADDGYVFPTKRPGPATIGKGEGEGKG